MSTSHFQRQAPFAPPIAGYPLGGAGAGAGLNLDVGGGLGLGGLGALGGFPGWTGWGGPYIPVTPLGALEGFKGDLVVPIVAVGVALFLLVLIVLAVKYALAWKLSVLDDIAGSKKFLRDLSEQGNAPNSFLNPSGEYMTQLAQIVTSAIYSNSCSDRMICEVGVLARGNSDALNGIISLVESYIPTGYQHYLEILKSSAGGKFGCNEKYQCNQQQGQPGNAKEAAVQQPVTPRPSLRDVVGLANETIVDQHHGHGHHRQNDTQTANKQKRNNYRVRGPSHRGDSYRTGNNEWA